MNTSGGIAYLLKHGRAPMGAVTRTSPPRGGVRSLAGGGTPVNAPLNYTNVPNYTFAPGTNVAPHYEYNAQGKLVYVPGKYASGTFGVAKPAQTVADAALAQTQQQAESPSSGDSSGREGRSDYGSTNPYTGSIGALMNGPVGVAIGRVANAFSGKQNPGVVPVVDATPVSIATLRDAEASMLAQNDAAQFGLGAYTDASLRDNDTAQFGDNGASAVAAEAAAEAADRDPGGAPGEARGGLNLHGRYFPHMATGGIAALAQGGQPQQGPRLLSGGGDGLSDSIPAVIGQSQPARLADGEFVISADVVSALGGGSTKAGSQKLYEMMDRIRQGAHGTKKQVKPVDVRKVLPA